MSGLDGWHANKAHHSRQDNPLQGDDWQTPLQQSRSGHGLAWLLPPANVSHLLHIRPQPTNLGSTQPLPPRFGRKRNAGVKSGYIPVCMAAAAADKVAEHLPIHKLGCIVAPEQQTFQACTMNSADARSTRCATKRLARGMPSAAKVHCCGIHSVQAFVRTGLITTSHAQQPCTAAMLGRLAQSQRDISYAAAASNNQ